MKKVVAQYLLENQHRIQEITISEISKTTFTPLSTTVRLALKWGYQEWKEMKKALLDKIQYLKKEPESVDANYPFKKGIPSIRLWKIGLLYYQKVLWIPINY